MTERSRIVVLGNVVRFPVAGMAWHYFQYVVGLARMGHDVWFLEDSGDAVECCYNPSTHVIGPDPSYGLRFTAEVLDRLGVGDRWAYHDAHGTGWHGPAADRILEICRSADVFLNVSGSVPVRPWLAEVPVRVLIDTDPAFEQIRRLTVPARSELGMRHNVFLSYGENIGSADCLVPDDGLPWKPTRQPVVLDLWPLTEVPSSPGPLTTVMQWDSYPAREWNGVRYGMKSETFLDYLDLPRRTGAHIELALGSPNAPRDLLRDHGWQLRDPLEVTRDPWTYQAYLQSSRAEFSPAKHGYVISRSGWFSERSAVYLACGRPVIAEDTGFTRQISTDLGVLAYDSPDSAAAAIEDLFTREHLHRQAAREIAAAHFDATTVLDQLLRDACERKQAPALQEWRRP